MNHLIALLDSDICANLVTALLHSLWQAVAIAGLLLLFMRSKAAKDSNVRYATALTALTAILLCGLFTWAVLEYEPAASGQAPSLASWAEETVFTTAPVETGAEHGLVRAETFGPENFSDGSVRSNWRVWAICVWLAGVAIMLLRAVYTAAGGARLRRRCRPLEDERILALVEQLRKSIGIARRIRVAVSQHIAIPGVVGCIWPTLLLPVSMVSGVATDDLRAILAHELAHVRRYDYLVNFCQMLIEAIFFFNPAVWWISKQIRFEREACCDKAGVAATGQRLRYAEVLADWAQRLKNTNVAAPAIGFGQADDKGTMLERVRRIVVAGHRPKLKVSWYVATITLLLSLAILIGLWRGTTMTVALAGKLLTPQQRIDKMKEIATTHDTQEPVYGPEDKIQLSGTIRMADGSKLPGDANFRIHGDRRRHNTTMSARRSEDGSFSTSINYYTKVVLCVTAEGYAPAMSKTYYPKPGDSISDIELVLDKGFEGRIRFVNKDGKPIPGTRVSGNYIIKTEGGWTGIDWIDEVVSGDDGIVIVEHCIDRPVKMSVRAHGYQAQDSKDVQLKPGEVYVWELADAEPASGIVVSRETGQPIAGAEIRLCRKEKSDHRWGFSGQGILLAKTDGQGQFVLGSLDEKWEYTFIVDAESYNRTVLPGVNMGDEGLRVELGPELHLSGRIIGDVNQLEMMSRKPIVRWDSSERHDGRSLHDNGWVDVEISDGEGHFTITDLMGDYLTIRAGGKIRQVEIADKSIDDLVIDLRPQTEVGAENVRQVVLEFEVPEESPLPEGEIRINSNYHGNHVGISQMYPIVDGQVRLEVSVPGQISYDLNWSQGPRIAGYWIERKSRFDVPAGDGPFVVGIPAHPAGAIYGQVLEADGTPAKNVGLHLMVIEKAPVMTRAFLNDVFGHEKSELGKFNGSPLPLGGEYMVVAYRDSTFVTSRPIQLEETDSIRQIELAFVDGVTVSGTVTDPNGKPFAYVSVSLSGSVSFPDGPSWGTGAGKTTTSRDGRFAFQNVNAKAPIHHTLNVDPGKGYQNVRMKIERRKRPLNIKLLRGYGLSGVVLDDATGWPIPGAQVTADAIKKTGKAGDWASTDDKTDKDGKFHFSQMGKREYRLYLPGAEIVNRKRTDTVTGGQTEQVTLRVKLTQWCELEPCKPSGKND